VLIVTDDDVEDQQLLDSAERLWIHKWNEYWDITQEEVARAGIYTWNHLLLKEGARPLPIGICWNPSLHSTGDVLPYFPVSKSALEQIGVGSHNTEDWIRSLLKLPVAFGEVPIKEGTTSWTELSHLKAIFDEVDGSGLETRTPSGVARKVFHLIRSYAIWGGSAFISIPVVIGTAGFSHTAVFSICTLRPLSSMEYRDWRLIAGVLLRPLLEREILDLAKQQDFVEAAYSIGHPFKHRFNDLQGSVDELYGSVTKFDRLFAGTPDASRFAEERKDLLEIREFVYANAQTCRRVSELMNFIASLRKANSFTQLKGKYLVDVPYRFVEHITKYCDSPFIRYFDSRKGCVSIGPNSVDQLKQCDLRIEPFTTSLWNNMRPFNSLYDELFYELLLNTAHYGVPNDCTLHIAIDRAKPNEPALLFTNQCNRSSLPANMPAGQWHKWGTGREGGLRFFAEHLSLTDTGYVECRADHNDMNTTFNVRVVLRGLTFNQNP